MYMLSRFSCVQLFVIFWTIATRLLYPWDSPGKNTGVGCHALLQVAHESGGVPWLADHLVAGRNGTDVGSSGSLGLPIAKCRLGIATRPLPRSSSSGRSWGLSLNLVCQWHLLVSLLLSPDSH